MPRAAPSWRSSRRSTRHAAASARTPSWPPSTRRTAGRCACPAVLMDALAAALRAAALTEGRVDPTVGQALVLAGYDRDFAAVRGSRIRRLRAVQVAGWRVVELDRDAGTVRVPAGVTLDLGATAKALAADRAAQRALAASGATGVLVNLGGDIATAGDAPPGGWAVRVADSHPRHQPGQELRIASGGLSTSSTTVRRWRRRGRDAHHIVDPHTGAPAREHWRTVSVAAATCLDANIASTAAIVLGAGRPRVARASRVAGAAGDGLRRGGNDRGLAGVIAAGDTGAVVSDPRDRAGHAAAADRQRRARRPAGAALVAARLAALRGRDAASRGLAAGRGAAGRPRADRGARQLRPDPPARRRAAVRRRLPPALAGAGRAGVRSAAGADRDEPVARAGWACGPGGVCTGWPTPAGRLRSFTRWGTGSDTRSDVDAGRHARMRAGRGGRGRMATGERMARAPRRARRCRRSRDARGWRSPRCGSRVGRSPTAGHAGRARPKTILAATPPVHARPAAQPSAFAKPFSASLRGRLRQGTSAGGLAVVDLRLRLTGGVPRACCASGSPAARPPAAA